MKINFNTKVLAPAVRSFGVNANGAPWLRAREIVARTPVDLTDDSAVAKTVEEAVTALRADKDFTAAVEVARTQEAERKPASNGYVRNKIRENKNKTTEKVPYTNQAGKTRLVTPAQAANYASRRKNRQEAEVVHNVDPTNDPRVQKLIDELKAELKALISS